ncbi:MAG TPA: pitrilysin family protein [Pyrinomonadaceae bacterium]|nr:pitrilysin family protein [Pyrinomonadaceae bacterium]
MNTKRTIIFLLAFVLFMTTTVSAQRGDSLPPIKYREMTLKNGLRVIMHEDRSTPIVAVNVWYHVGSKNETAGRTGFAHLFEHMMFQGSKNWNTDYFKPLDAAGASVNGSTNADRTNYYEVLPSNFLETALFLEADRMGNLLEAMTQEKLDNQRDVVKNERRQRYDNQPYGTAGEKIMDIIYPKSHPYSWTTIGSLDDLTAASQDDVKAFFRQYYVPNNASLVIAGDFNPKQARAWVQKYFGAIKKGAEIPRPTPPQPTMQGIIRKEFEDAVQSPRVYMVWHTVPQGHKDEPALDILSSILSGGRGSRLQSKLVYDRQIVQDVFTSHPTREIAGTFQVTATARPNGPKDIDEMRANPAKFLMPIEEQINIEIERIKKEAPSMEEVSRAVNRIESQTIFGLQTVLAKADAMNSNATFYNKPDRFQEQLDEYRRVTPADVVRVANAYLNANHLVMNFVPRKDKTVAQTNAAANTPASKSAKEKSNVDQTKNLPKAGAEAKFTLPTIEKQRLSNGLEVWLVRQSELPIVSMNMVFKSGGTIDPSGKAGLASFTSSLLNSGTKTRSAVDISNQLSDIGAAFGTGSNWDAANVSLQTLTKNLDKALDIYADVIVNPTFPEKELETLRRRSLFALQQRRDNPNAIAGVVYNALLYGRNHPYGNSLGGDEISIKSFKQSDLENFYKTYYRPNNAVLIVVGDAALDTLKSKLETAFAAWKPGEVPASKVPEAAAFDKPGIYVVDKPGAAQSIISIGQVGVARDNPDYFPLMVMNDMLGGSFSSRLNMNLREDKGYTYGAGSGFGFRRGAGPFTASAGVQTAVTKESVMEFMKELNGIRGERPITQEELETSKQSLIRGMPQGFETNGQIANQLGALVTYDLPGTYFNDFFSKVNAVTLADVNRVAQKYLTPDKMAIVIVGDRSAIEPRLREIEVWGKTISYLDPEGNPIKIE